MSNPLNRGGFIKIKYKDDNGKDCDGFAKIWDSPHKFFKVQQLYIYALELGGLNQLDSFLILNILNIYF